MLMIKVVWWMVKHETAKLFIRSFHRFMGLFRPQEPMAPRWEPHWDEQRKNITWHRMTEEQRELWSKEFRRQGKTAGRARARSGKSGNRGTP